MSAPCALCGDGRPRFPKITGFHYGPGNTVEGIAYLCTPPCTNNRVIPIGEASQDEIDQALLIPPADYAVTA